MRMADIIMTVAEAASIAVFVFAAVIWISFFLEVP